MLYIEKRKTNDSTFLTSLTIFKCLDNIMLLNLSNFPLTKIIKEKGIIKTKVTGLKRQSTNLTKLTNTLVNKLCVY